MKKIILYTILILSIYSCKEDQPIGSGNEEILEVTQNEFELTDFVWKKMIDRPSLPKNYDSFYPFIHEGKVVFNNWKLGGFVAFDLKTGETIWDNRGSSNEEHLPVKPIKIDNNIYTIKTSELRKVNLDNGEIELAYSWPKDDEYMDYEFNIDGNTLYADVHEFAVASTFSGWASCTLDRLEEADWKYIDRQYMINNNNYQRHFGAPSFHINAKGEKLMIYSCIYATLAFEDQYARIEAYNLDNGELEWSNENSLGGSLLLPLKEENKVYYAEGKSIHCVDAESGNTIWRTGDGVLDEVNIEESIIPYKDMLIVLCNEGGRTVAISKEDGSLRWEQSFGGWQGQLYHKGSRGYTANFYKDRLYYVNGWGRLISMDPNDGSYRSFKFPQYEIDEELDLDLFEQDFKQGHMIISEDGIIYSADGIRFLAFEVPDKDM